MKSYLIALLVLLSCLPLVGNAQQGLVRGKVVDASTKEPIPGVNIVLKGTTKGVVTDLDGNYQVGAAPTDTLLFTFIGYVSQAVPVANRSTVDVSLSQDVVALNEVVVTGYTSERKKDLTGAVSVVEVEEMKKMSTANPMRAIQGRVAGVTVTGDGHPGAGATIRIRGIGTMNDNDPLYIIDGVPTKTGIQQLNPADIESMQVLKDASAASIYGSRAANGVIIITTKRGKAGKTQVEFNAYNAVSSYAGRTKMLDTEGYGRVYWQARVNAGQNPNDNNIGYQFDWGTDPQTGQPVLNQVITPEFLDAEKTLRASNTDWFNEVSRTGVIQNYDVSLSSGTDNGSYLFSLGYFDNKGIMNHSNYNRLTARLNTDHRLFNNKVVVGQNLSLTKSYEVGFAPMHDAMQALPIIPVRTADGSGWGGPIGGMNDRQNPVRILEDNKQNGSHFLRLFGNVYADVAILKNLKFRSNLGVDYGNGAARNYRVRYKSGYLSNNMNRLESRQSHSVGTVWYNTLNYNLELGKHRMDVLAGTEYVHNNFTSFWASRENFLLETDDYMYLDAGTGAKDNGGSGGTSVLFSYFSRANYSFADKYLLSATVRRDGSSRFGQNNRFAVFPAFSAGWRVSEEGFFKDNVGFINELKVRYGWGMTGNQEIGDFGIHTLYAADYNRTAYDIGGNKSGVLPSGYLQRRVGNPNLRWEATTMSNFGIDFGLFGQKVYGSMEIFTRRTEGILFEPAYIAVKGEGGQMIMNGPSMENKGFELSLGSHHKIGKDITVDLNGNFDMFRNKVTYLPKAVENAYGGNGKGDNILGHPYTTDTRWYGWVADGIFRSEEEVASHADQGGKGVGRIRFKDLNDDGVVNDDDRTWLGNPYPDFAYGFNTVVGYKGFDLSIFLQGVQGIDIINDFKRNTDFWGVSETGSNKGARLLDAWSPSNPDSNIPAIQLGDVNWEARPSTYFIENGSYLRVRNAQLGYTFNNQLLQKFRMQSLRLYVGGDNLGILMKSKSFTGVDPENANFGYPNPRVFTGGINIRL
jgi:TonB-linked SusC/RagA family outer membrane protein